ncbi:MAG: antirestriction protein ArdA [Heteroscytonema crispum UTEX LB 1556]
MACLASYTCGILHGDWIDAAQDEDALHEEVKEILSSSPIPNAEEFAIHDHECFFGVEIGEYTPLSEVSEIACFIEEYGELGAEILKHCSYELDTAKRTMKESYLGMYKSVAEYAQELTEETTEIPESLASYIDYESMANDMELSGDIHSVEIGGTVHVFRNE